MRRELFSYIDTEDQIASEHALRAIRALVEEVLEGLSRGFSKFYSHTGRPSIPPEQLLKASLLQAFLTIRSRRSARCAKLPSMAAPHGTRATGSASAPASASRKVSAGQDHRRRCKAQTPGHRKGQRLLHTTNDRLQSHQDTKTAGDNGLKDAKTS